MIEPIWAVTGLLVPMLLAGMMMLLLVRPWRAVCEQRRVRGGWALAVGVGFSVGYFATLGWPSAPMVAVYYLGLMAIGTTALFFMISRLSRRFATDQLTAMAQVLVAGAMPPLLLVAYVRLHWSIAESAIWLIGLVFVSWQLHRGMDGLSRRAGRELPFVWALAAGLMGVANLMSAGESVGQLGLVLAVVLIGGGIITFFVSCDIAGRGLTYVIMPIYLGLILLGHFYNGLIGWHAVVLAIAPLAAWAGELPMIKRRDTRWQHALVRGVAVVGVLLIAMVPIVLTFVRDLEEVNPY